MFVVPVLINNSITLNFVVDSGAADVRIPAVVVLTLTPVQGSLLVGQRFLGRFKSWSIDNSKQALLLE